MPGKRRDTGFIIYIKYRDTNSGIVKTHRRRVTTLIRLAYSASLPYTCAICVIEDAAGEMAARNVTSSTVSPWGNRLPRPLNLSRTRVKIG